MPTPRIGGTGTDSFSSHFSTGDYVLTASDTLDHVLFQPTPDVPAGGSIDLTLHVDRTRSTANPANRTFDVVVHVEFTGGDTATISLDSAQNYTLTLSTGDVVKS